MNGSLGFTPVNSAALLAMIALSQDISNTFRHLSAILTRLQPCRFFMPTQDSAISSLNPEQSIVVMGVAGCGKSSMGKLLAQSVGWPLIEGDAHHSPLNLDKMRQGIPLNDHDREGWLNRLADILVQAPEPSVLTCSALRRSYRDRLRSRYPGLRFVFIDITREQAVARVLARPNHFFSSSLVDSQFATLESPVGEKGVLRLDRELPLEVLLLQVLGWLPMTTTEKG